MSLYPELARLRIREALAEGLRSQSISALWPKVKSPIHKRSNH